MTEDTSMFQLDNQFLIDCGLAELSDADKKLLTRLCYSALELRVGERLSHGLSEEQLDEFADIFDGVDSRIDEWLAQHAPDFEEREVYRRLARAMPDASAESLRHEAAATLWLAVNRGDYQDVVFGVVEEMREELIRFRDVLLESES